MSSPARRVGETARSAPNVAARSCAAAPHLTSRAARHQMGRIGLRGRLDVRQARPGRRPMYIGQHRQGGVRERHLRTLHHLHQSDLRHVGHLC